MRKAYKDMQQLKTVHYLHSFHQVNLQLFAVCLLNFTFTVPKNLVFFSSCVCLFLNFRCTQQHLNTNRLCSDGMHWINFGPHVCYFNIISSQVEINCLVFLHKKDEKSPKLQTKGNGNSLFVSEFFINNFQIPNAGINNDEKQSS